MSYISKYLSATDGDEAPLSFHLWSCMASLSVAAGRRFWFKLGRLQYYPNLYVLLVAEPGVKKSTAMDVAKNLVRESGVTPLAASQTTREAIGKMMSHEKFKGKKYYQIGNETVEYNQLAVFATEFTQFISVNPEGMLEFFTAVYGEKVHTTDYKNAGSDYVDGPYITLLGCLTPHMLKGYLKMNVLTGGFARRTVFVYGTRGRIVPIPEAPPPEILTYLRDWIKKLQFQSGEFSFGPGGQEWYVNWYTHLQTNLKEISKPSTESYYNTKQELLFKVSMLIALAESDGEGRELTPAHFELAEKRFFKPVELHLERVFEGSGINPNSGVATQVCRMLEAYNQPMNKKTILGMFGDQATDWRALQDTIAHLVMVGRLVERTLSSNGQLIGTILGTPEAIAGRSDVELAAFLTAHVVPPVVDTGSREEAGPSA